MRTDSRPALLGVNGPPEAGKTWLMSSIQKLIPDAIIMRPSDFLYEVMQREGSAPRGMLYQDFKRLPDSRPRLISKATELRARDVNVFDRLLVESDTFNSARVVIIDNFGFQSEVDWYDRFGSAMIVLRLDTKYNELEPLKSRGRRRTAPWENDSRSPVEYHTMLTAYDSLQMKLLLEWLNRPLTHEEAGPYNGIKSLWDRYFAAS